MITRDIDAFIAVARTLKPDFGPATARAAFLVSPDGFVRAQRDALTLSGVPAARVHCELFSPNDWLLN